MRVFICLTTILIYQFIHSATWAQSSNNISESVTKTQTTDHEKKRLKANSGTVSIMTYFHGAYSRIGADLANVLDNRNGLRVLPIMGTGSVQNIEDVLYLRGVDLGIVQGDVLNYLANIKKRDDVKERITYVTKLYNQEIHILARKEIKSLTDLRGKKVNFSLRKTGSRISAFTIFNRLKIPVEEVNYDERKALQFLNKGHISAMVFVDGQPSSLFGDIPENSKLHFLSIPYAPSLHDTYLPTRLTHKNYPNLIPEGKDVKNVATPTVMIAYRWKDKTKRYTKVSRFINTFFDNFRFFHSPSRHSKWKEVSLSARLPGWQRFPAAQEWLDAKKAKRVSEVNSNTGITEAKAREMFDRILQRLPQKLNERQRQALYLQFKATLNPSQTSKETPGGTLFAAERQFRIAVGDGPGSPQDAIAQDFARLLKRKTNGRLIATVSHDAELGSEQDTVTYAAKGTLAFSVLAINNITPWSPTVGTLTLPYVILSLEDAEKITQGPIGQRLVEDTVRSAGVRIIGWSYTGFRVLTNSKKPVRSVADLKGLVIRVPKNKIMEESYKAWGIQPIPMGWAETPPALRQRAIDGQDNPYMTVKAMRFFEFQKYITNIRYIFSIGPLIVSEKIFQSLPKEDQKAILDAAQEATLANGDFLRRNENLAKQYLISRGMQIYDPVDNEREFIRKARTIWPKFYESIGGVSRLNEILIALGRQPAK